MINSLSPMIGIASAQSPASVGNSGIANYSGTAAEKVETEFLSIFYKEMLKQAFKVPDLSPVGEEKENNYISSISNDILIDQLTQEMLKNQSLRSSLLRGDK